MVEMNCGEGVCLQDEDCEGSIAFRAALMSGVQEFHVAHAPGSRAVFIQAIHWRQWLQNAAHEGYVPAMYDYGLCCDDPKRRAYWLRMAAERGHLRAMYLLGMECDDLSERRRWLRMAAEDGHVPAIYEFALLCSHPHEKRRWLEEAARNGLQAAMIEMAELGC
jgi:TPR repeat protein